MSTANNVELIYKCKIISHRGHSNSLARPKSTATTSTTAADMRSSLAGYINPLQAKSRRHPHSTMRPTRTKTQERLEPMHIWERIDVRCVDILWRPSGGLLSRPMSGVVEFLVLWKFGTASRFMAQISKALGGKELHVTVNFRPGATSTTGGTRKERCCRRNPVTGPLEGRGGELISNCTHNQLPIVSLIKLKTDLIKLSCSLS
ncbi:hypothetical protein P692DRAFT_20726115 [Suillus brevipes Sb2]|nr:hypothetical protein P692DRAFT_20726115 [Suillus brevipes Sb2]